MTDVNQRQRMNFRILLWDMSRDKYKKQKVVCVPMRKLTIQATMYKKLAIAGQSTASTRCLGSLQTASYRGPQK